MAKSRKPDYRIWVTSPDSKIRGTIGGAWLNEDGSLNLKLDPCVVLGLIPGMTIKLFPSDSAPPEREPAGQPEREHSDDDIPF